MTQIATIEPAQELSRQQQQTSAMSLAQWAMANNATVEQMEKLYELQRRVEADSARNAFNHAMAQFKNAPPTIRKNKHVKHNDFWHATIDEIVAKITPALSAVGIRHRWDIDQSKSPQITVTCILSHEMGHSESTPLTATADTSGSKNAIQAIGSAVTYLQRYTLLAATGLAASGTDDDGQASVKSGMQETDLIQYLDAIKSARTAAELKSFFGNAYKAAQGCNDTVAMADIKKAYDKRKGEIQ